MSTGGNLGQNSHMLPIVVITLLVKGLTFNKLKSLKVAKSKDDDGGVVDGSVDAVSGGECCG